MAVNPFELLKQLQNIQARVGEIQERLRSVRATGSAGGELVKIELNGQMGVESVKISAEAVDPKDVAMLEDLVFSALSDALAKIKERLKEEVSQMTGGIGLPPGIMGF